MGRGFSPTMPRRLFAGLRPSGWVRGAGSAQPKMLFEAKRYDLLLDLLADLIASEIEQDHTAAEVTGQALVNDRRAQSSAGRQSSLDLAGARSHVGVRAPGRTALDEIAQVADAATQSLGSYKAGSRFVRQV